MVAFDPQTVLSDDEGIRLDRWFKRHYPHISFVLVQKMIRKGQVRRNGSRVSGEDRLEAGDQLRLPPLFFSTTPPPPLVSTRAAGRSSGYAIKLRDFLIYEDEFVFVINKPAGLASQGGTNISISVDDLAPDLLDPSSEGISPPRPKLVHRLDKDTSGLLILARTAKAAEHLSKQLKSHEMKKTYWAAVWGCPQAASGKIDKPLKKMRRGGEEKMEVHSDGDSAVTFYTVRESAAAEVSWLELQPQTGRTHQLRVHCAFLGHPIVGDGKYGKKGGVSPELGSGLLLHARSLEFELPNGKVLKLEAPLQKNFRETFDFLGWAE